MKKILINKLKSNSLKNRVNYNSFITMDIETMIKNNYQITSIFNSFIKTYIKLPNINDKIIIIFEFS